MSDNDGEGGSGNEALSIMLNWIKSPSKGFSSIIFGLGIWGLILGVVNVVFGAVIAGERKVVHLLCPNKQ